jgi:hypothetical protein
MPKHEHDHSHDDAAHELVKFCCPSASEEQACALADLVFSFLYCQELILAGQNPPPPYKT